MVRGSGRAGGPSAGYGSWPPRPCWPCWSPCSPASSWPPASPGGGQPAELGTHADDAIEIDHRGPVLIRRDYAQAQVPIPKGMPIRYQAMKNSVQTIAIAMKNGVISAITVPIPDRLS